MPEYRPVAKVDVHLPAAAGSAAPVSADSVFAPLTLAAAAAAWLVSASVRWVEARRSSDARSARPMNTLSEPPIRPHQRRAVIAMVTGAVLMGIWAVIAPLHGAVIATGRVMPDVHRKTINHLEGGIVEHIAVQEGDWVRAGQPLLLLDTTQALANEMMVIGKLVPAIRQRDRLLAEQLDTANPAWTDLHQLGLASTNDAAIRARELALFQHRRDQLRQTLAIYTQSLEQLSEQRENLGQQLRMHREHIALFRDEIGDLDRLFASGMVSKVRLRGLQRDMLAQQGARSAVESQLSVLDERMAETALKRQLAEREWQSGVLSDLQAAEEQVALLTEQHATAQDVRSRATVVAPIDGVVLDMQVHTVGGVIQRGQKLLDLVPSDSPLVVHARVNPTDIDNIASGQTTQVRFSGFSQRSAIPSEATVRSVSADLVQDAQTGERYYLAQIALSTGVRAENQLVAGMPVEVMILTHRRSLFDYLTQPLTDSFNRAMREV